MILRQMTKDELIKEQMKTIGVLQDKIKLMQFDISTYSKELSMLKEKYKRKSNTFAKVRAELSMMKKTKNFDKITTVIRMIKDLDVSEEDNEDI